MLRQSLADVRGKRDEIVGERDRLEKDLGSERVAAASLRAEVERLAGALRDEKAAKEAAQKASVASDESRPSGPRWLCLGKIHVERWRSR